MPVHIAMNLDEVWCLVERCLAKSIMVLIGQISCGLPCKKSRKNASCNQASAASFHPRLFFYPS